MVDAIANDEHNKGDLSEYPVWIALYHNALLVHATELQDYDDVGSERRAQYWIE